MLLQRDMQLHMNPLGPPFRWIPRQRDLLRNLNDVLCLLWMLQQMDLLLHTDIVKVVKVYVMFAMDASTDGLVVAHKIVIILLFCFVCHVIMLDLLWRQQF